MKFDAETVERLSGIASSYVIGSFNAKLDDGYDVTDEGLLFSYRFGASVENGVLAPGDGGNLLVRWNGSAVDIPGTVSDSFELPGLPESLAVE